MYDLLYFIVYKPKLYLPKFSETESQNVNIILNLDLFTVAYYTVHDCYKHLE